MCPSPITALFYRRTNCWEKFPRLADSTCIENEVNFMNVHGISHKKYLQKICSDIIVQFVRHDRVPDTHTIFYPSTRPHPPFSVSRLNKNFEFLGDCSKVYRNNHLIIDADLTFIYCFATLTHTHAYPNIFEHFIGFSH